MGFIERLTGVGMDEGTEMKLASDTVTAALAEVTRGHLTMQDVAAAFDLSENELLEAEQLRSFMGNPPSTLEADNVLDMAEQNVPPYNVASVIRSRLGII